jgi:hypothetical protein
MISSGMGLCQIWISLDIKYITYEKKNHFPLFFTYSYSFSNCFNLCSEVPFETDAMKISHFAGMAWKTSLNYCSSFLSAPLPHQPLLLIHMAQSGFPHHSLSFHSFLPVPNPWRVCTFSSLAHLFLSINTSPTSYHSPSAPEGHFLGIAAWFPSLFIWSALLLLLCILSLRTWHLPHSIEVTRLFPAPGWCSDVWVV